MRAERTAIASPSRLLPAIRLRPAWLGRLLVWLFWVAYFGFALIVLVLRHWVLPNIEHYRADIARSISRTAGLPVSIARIDTHWQGLRPQLTLRGFSIHDAAGRPGLTFDTVETELAWSSLWHRQLRLHRLEVDSPALHIRRERDGRIYVAGILLNTEAGGADFSDWLLAQGHIIVRNASIRWQDELRQAPVLELTQLHFVLHNSGNRHRFALTAAPPRGLAARLDVRGDFRGEDLDVLEAWKGQVYAEIDYADLAGWRAWLDYPLELPQGRGGLRLWLDFAERRLQGLTADIALADVRLRLAPELPLLDLKHLNGRIAARRAGDGYEILTRRLALGTAGDLVLPPTDFTLRWQPASGRRPAQGTLSANGLDLDVLGRLAAFLPLDEDTRQLLSAYAPRGRLHDLRLGWKGETGAWSAFSVHGRFEDLGLRAQGYFPGFAGLSGSIEGNEKGGTVSLDSHQALLELPRVFADPRLQFERLQARANWTLAEGRLEVQLHHLAFDNRDAAGSASGRYRSSPDGPGEIDLTAGLNRAEGAAVWRYMPLVVNPDVRDWLRSAITGGRADETRLRLKGDLRDFPFADGKTGLFRVSAKIVGADLRYAPDWPAIERIDGELLFEGRRMLIRASRGGLYGLTVTGVSAEIADLEAAQEIMTVSGRAAGPTADFLRFLETSPLGARLEDFTADLRASGQGQLQLRLTLPLRRLDDTLVEGEYQFLRNELLVDADLPPLTDVSGRMHFTGSSIRIREARAQWLGAPLVLRAATREDGAVQVEAEGNLGIAALRRTIDHRLFDHLSGSAPWQASLLVRRRGADFRLQSHLQGIASSLPEPFNKTAAERLALRLERSSSAERDELRIALGDQLVARFQRRREGGRLVIERGLIGIGETPALPERGVLLAASVPVFDADFWRALFAADGGHAVTRLSLRCGELIAFERPFRDVTLRAVLQEGAWQGQVMSRELNGDFSWKTEGRGRLSARLRQLVLHDNTRSAGAPSGEPLRELPGLDVVAEAFTLRGRNLGRLELTATNEANAWKLERLVLSNTDGSLVSEGLWSEAGTRLDFRLETSNIGRLMERLGYEDAVRRGTARIEGRVSWAGAPTRLDHATLDGSLRLEAANGQFNKLEPGVGRLLGILSLQALPRRITLDFRDIFSEGFAFDSINGSARLAKGVMSTQDLQIQGPSAKILMKGEVDIPAETQNLRVRIEPALGETLAVGAMIANPAVGAAAWLAQRLLKDPVGQMFAYEYRITGSWSDPKVEKVPQQTAKKEEGVP